VLSTTELEREYVTNAVEEKTVTSPPPELLKMTAPGVVETGAAPLGVVGASARLVGAGIVDAVNADDAASSLLSDPSALVSDACWLLSDAASLLTDVTALDCVVFWLTSTDVTLDAADDKLLFADDKLVATDDKLLSTETMLAEAELTVVVVLLARLASSTRWVASGGFSEWTCSIALRSLLKTP